MGQGILVGIYLVGVAIGLIVMRDRWPARIVAALAWPLGVVALAVVATILSIAAVYLWPVPILATLALAAAVWLAM
jgi:hypothetical protein